MEITNELDNNNLIYKKLHVIVISNPYRYILVKQFINKFKNDINIILYFIELTYNSQLYYRFKKS